MKKAIRRIIATLLSVCMIFGAIVTASADSGEVYLSELRLVYADSIEEARSIIKNSQFADYEVLNHNLNRGTDKKGVYLAYKTTTDIEDAITDIAVMQMDGGYREGNYQQMIQESYNEYLKVGAIYKDAIDYFADAYEAGDFLAESAYRQLNFYSDVEDHKGVLLGDLFVTGIEVPELATMFLEGNSNVLNNVRALLAMGVSYNEDGRNYLELVGEAVYAADADPEYFENYDNYGDFDTLAMLISATVLTFKDMIKELETVELETEFDYTDDEITDREIRYAEYNAIASMLMSVEYLGNETLYDFCKDYVLDEGELDVLYPLVAALNKGQIAMTKVGHFYDVVRYSMPDIPEEYMDDQITELEEIYSENPFDIYTGVDRSIFKGTFALTSEAYRADSMSSNGFSSFFAAHSHKFQIALGTVGAGLFVWAIIRTVSPAISRASAQKAAAAVQEAAQQRIIEAVNQMGTMKFGNNLLGTIDFNTALDTMISSDFYLHAQAEAMMKLPFYDKLNAYASAAEQNGVSGLPDKYLNYIQEQVAQTQNDIVAQSAQESAQAATKSTAVVGGTGLTAFLYVASAVAMIVAALSYYNDIKSQKNPEYSDVPLSLVDLIETEDGDRYVKYDVVMEAEPDENGEYFAGDLNAYSAQRWNALYYTKSYEAGAPLLATFAVREGNNTPEKNYLPVHAFGEKVCYNVNKYNFKQSSPSIYLSVKQSENEKYASAGVPEVIGTIISGGFYVLSAGFGIAAGVGATLGIQALKKKKKEDGGKEA